MGDPSRTVLAGCEVALTNPDKVFFPRAGYTKLDLIGIGWVDRRMVSAPRG